MAATQGHATLAITDPDLTVNSAAASVVDSDKASCAGLTDHWLSIETTRAEISLGACLLVNALPSAGA